MINVSRKTELALFASAAKQSSGGLWIGYWIASALMPRKDENVSLGK